MARTPTSQSDPTVTEDIGSGMQSTSDFRARLPLIIIVAFTLISCGAVVYNALAPTTSEKLNEQARTVAATACRDAYERLKKLPVIATTAASEAADLLEAENTIFVAMAKQLATARPTNAVGATAYSGWVADWNGVNTSRAAYATKLRNDDPRPELLLPKDGSAPVTNRMNKYSRTHNLIVCATHNLQAEIVDGVRNYPNDPTKVP